MAHMTTTYSGITYVIPCSGRKLPTAAPAAELYVGQMFRHTYERAVECARLDQAGGLGPARVLILSARYGLITPERVIDPYDQKMGSPGSIDVKTLAEQAVALGIDWGCGGVYGLLPRPYLARLDAALRTLDVFVQDVYEGCGGIGEQRRVNALISRPVITPIPEPSASEPGPQVWIGADSHAFWWGLPILVSYDRLRDVRTLPVAAAPWVLDSRGFVEVAQHGGWTIPAATYVADVRRFEAEIGRLVWVAPQDWPAHPRLLERTGLPEAVHQARTTASVIELRAELGDLVMPVLTGTTIAGYLRHLAAYAAAGFDLATEPIVGVGALVGRPPTQAAGIVRALAAAGLTRLHGFGVKGRVLDEVGPLFASIDSAEWSGEARWRGGACTHGLVTWETNCPTFAREWAAAQRRRAAGADVQPALFAA
jgi:hypothetical protein